jgi:transglutaminase-like putative cysteine protease
MKLLVKSIVILGYIVIGLGIALPLYALPATLSLPPAIRPGLTPLTLEDAATQLQATDQTGWALIEAARALVSERMTYSRRNSFDSHRQAFERGYGYCQQHAYALQDLLGRLGFAAEVVHSFSNAFPDGQVAPHAWVRVTFDGETRDVDSLFYNAEAGTLAFTPQGTVYRYSSLFRVIAGWGSTAVNAHRYYRTGSDTA